MIKLDNSFSRVIVYNEDYIVKEAFPTLRELERNYPLDRINILTLFNSVNIDVDIILQMKNLTALHIENSKITGNLRSINCFGELPQLVELVVNHNKITYVKNLGSFKRLFSLNLDFNEINKVKSSLIPPDLESISLRHNKIREVDDIYGAYWKGLVAIYLSYNYLKSFIIPEPLQFLEILDLSNNYLTHIEKLSNLRNLQILKLKGNPFPDNYIQNIRTKYRHIQVE